MKIGIIFPKDSESIFDRTSLRTFGGATVQMFAIANELIKGKENDVFCLVPKIDNKESLGGIGMRIVEFSGLRKTILSTIILFHRIMKSEKPDILIQHGLTFYSCLLSLYCRALSIKFIFMFAHDIEVGGRYQRSQARCLFFSLLLKTATLLVTQNDFQNNTLLKKGYRNILFKMGFPMRQIIGKEREGILWIGRCSKQKQPELFIKIAQKNPDKKFTMVCPKIDENYFNYIKSLAEVVHNLVFVDFVDFENTWKYFEETKVFVNTSISEGFPQTFVQAVTCGVPIISLNVNPDDFILKYSCGYACGGDVTLLENNVSRLFHNDNLYNQISENTLVYSRKYHDIVQNVADMINAIR
jgi:glycosyltransferase involved in cell wall biosynthesis